MSDPTIPTIEPFSLEMLYDVTADNMREYVAERLREIYNNLVIEDEDARWGFSYDAKGRLMLDMWADVSPHANDTDDLDDYDDYVYHYKKDFGDYDDA